jgi:hypothetical protein
MRPTSGSASIFSISHMANPSYAGTRTKSNSTSPASL